MAGNSFLSYEDEVEMQNKASDFFEVINEPFKLIEKVSKPDSKAVRTLKKIAFPWKQVNALHVNKFMLSQKVQILDFKITQMISNIKNLDQHEEIFIKRISLNWKPYVSSNLPGMTTVFLTDFRSSSWKNILKGGYVWKSSESVHNMSISPGYLINLKDPNLDKIFRLICLTAGLDMIEGSIFGSLELEVEFSVSTSSVDLKLLDRNQLTLVSNKNAATILQNESETSNLLTDKILIEDVIKAFNKDLFSQRKPEVEVDLESNNGVEVLSSSSSSQKVFDFKDLEGFLSKPRISFSAGQLNQFESFNRSRSVNFSKRFQKDNFIFEKNPLTEKLLKEIEEKSKGKEKADDCIQICEKSEENSSQCTRAPNFIGKETKCGQEHVPEPFSDSTQRKEVPSCSKKHFITSQDFSEEDFVPFYLE